MQEQKYLPVNWTDGMKINKSHFISQDNAFTYQSALNTGSSLNEYNYGLLPGFGKNVPGVKLYLNLDNQLQVQLRLLQCEAITRGGYYIQLEEDSYVHANDLVAPVVETSLRLYELKEKASIFYVVLTIDPYRRVPHGLAHLDESPPRLPYSMPAFGLSLIPVPHTAKNVLGLFHLPVGKLKIEAERVILDEEYIPPCSAINSHFDLLELHAGLEQFYGKMELYSLQIIQKILQKKQLNDMAGIVQKLCEQVAIFTASQLPEIKTLSVHQPPVHLVNRASSFARLFKNTLDFYTGSGKEEFMNYCNEWCNTAQGELEGTITALTNQVYDHLDIKGNIEKVTAFTSTIATLFSNLAKLDYIGKRKEAGIFVKEKLVTSEPEEPRKRRSFLAD